MNITALCSTYFHALIDCGRRADQMVCLCLREYANLLVANKIPTLAWLLAMRQQVRLVCVLNVSRHESVS